MLKLAARGHSAFIHAEHRADAFRAGLFLLPLDVLAVCALTVQQVRYLARGQRLRRVDPKPLRQCRVHVLARRRGRAAIIRPAAGLVHGPLKPRNQVVVRPGVAHATQRSNRLVSLNQPGRHESALGVQLQLGTRQGVTGGVAASLRKAVGLARHQLVKHLAVRKSAAGRLARVAPCRRLGWRRRAQALLVILGHRRHLRRKRLLHQVLAHRASCRRGAGRSCAIRQHVRAWQRPLRVRRASWPPPAARSLLAARQAGQSRWSGSRPCAG